MRLTRLIAPVVFAALPLQAVLPGSESLAKIILAEFDSNTNDELDTGEWQGGVNANFDELDGNGDGSLQAGELDEIYDDIENHLGEAGADVVMVLMKQLLMSLDTDKNSLVSRKEYSALTTTIFTSLDGNKDTSLSLTELAELPVKMLAR
jgi:hypothetical protein